MHQHPPPAPALTPPSRLPSPTTTPRPRLQGGGEPPGLDDAQRRLLTSEGRFLHQLLDNSTMDDYRLPIQ